MVSDWKAKRKGRGRQLNLNYLPPHRAQAITYYSQGRNQDRLAECYYIAEDYSGLEKMAEALPENHRLLPEIAKMFASVGMCAQALFSFVKCNRIRDAIDVCVHLHQWNMAIDLAKQHNVREIDSLLAKYATHLLEKNNLVHAIELYRKAGRYLEAAKLMYKLAKEASAKRSQPLKVKKMFVLTGLLIEQYHEHNKLQAKAKNKTKKDVSSISILPEIWQKVMFYS